MNIADLFRRATSAVSQSVARAMQNLAIDATVPGKVQVLRHQVVSMEARLYRLERTSDSFTTRTGQRVESREVSQLRRELEAKKYELAGYEDILRERAANSLAARKMEIIRQIR